MRRFHVVLISILLIAGANQAMAAKRTTTKQRPPVVSQQVTSRNISLPSFDRIVVEGRINLNLHTGYKKSGVLLKGCLQDINQVKAIIQGNTLFLTLGKGYPSNGFMFADIKTRRIYDIKYVGEGFIRGAKLRSNALNLDIMNKGVTKLGGYLRLSNVVIRDSGYTELSGVNSSNLNINIIGHSKVKLTGTANVRNINMNGNGWLGIYWIKSDNLCINGHSNGVIKLAGIVKRLQVELWDNACFEGQYLRARESFIRTHNKSVARISTENKQHSVAFDRSDIFFYNMSKFQTNFMTDNGSVLNMRSWNPYRFEDYTMYNKRIP